MWSSGTLHWSPEAGAPGYSVCGLCVLAYFSWADISVVTLVGWVGPWPSGPMAAWLWLMWVCFCLGVAPSMTVRAGHYRFWCAGMQGRAPEWEPLRRSTDARHGGPLGEVGKNEFGGLPVPAVAVCQVNRAGGILEELFRARLVLRGMLGWGT